MDTISQSEPRSNDVSNLTRESVRIPHTNICFGDLTREEINNVLTTAGASLIPPKSVSVMLKEIMQEKFADQLTSFVCKGTVCHWRKATHT